MGEKTEEDTAKNMLDWIKRVEFLLLTSSASWPMYTHTASHSIPIILFQYQGQAIHDLLLE